jgi:hypothetical protein
MFGGNSINQGGHGAHGHHHHHHHGHHGHHDAAAQGSKCGRSEEGGQDDPSQMFQHSMPQRMQGQG